MDKRNLVGLWNNLWGWFVICVMIAGVPVVVDFAYGAVKATATKVKCEFTECYPSLVYPSSELIEQWQGRLKKGKLPTMEDSELALLLAIKETNGL